MGQRKSVVCMLYSFYTDSEEAWNVLRLQFHSLLKVTFKQDRFIYYLWKMCRLTAIRPIRFTFRGEVPAPSCSHHLDSTIYDSGRVTPKILSVKKFFRCHVFWLFYVFIQKKKKKAVLPTWETWQMISDYTIDHSLPQVGCHRSYWTSEKYSLHRYTLAIARERSHPSREGKENEHDIPIIDVSSQHN